MAANAVVGLTGTLKSAKEGSPHIFREMEAALSLSCWTEDLDLEEWRVLDGVVKSGCHRALEMVCKEMLVRVCLESADLGYPSNREEWHRAKYGEGV